MGELWGRRCNCPVKSYHAAVLPAKAGLVQLLITPGFPDPFGLRYILRFLVRRGFSRQLRQASLRAPPGPSSGWATTLLEPPLIEIGGSGVLLRDAITARSDSPAIAPRL